MRDYTFMGVTTAARTAVALGTLLILARTLGPSNFGFISIVITWSTIATLVTDYGFGMRALRDIGAERERAGEIIFFSLTAKTLLALIVCLTIFPLIFFIMKLRADERLVVFFFLLGTLANSYGDLGLTVFRSLGQFHRETRIVMITSALHFVVVGLAIWLSNELLVIGFSFLISRLAYASLALSALSSLLSLSTRTQSFWRGIAERFRSSTSLAVDSGATNIFAQLDVILVNHLAGREAAGIYFAGSRLLQGAVPFSVLLASVHIPRFAYRLRNNSADLLRYSRRIFVEYVGMGLCFALAFLFIGPVFTLYFLGSGYEELNTLWLAFACFTATRFIAAGLGIQLIALDTGFLRTIGIVASGVVTVVCYWFFIPLKGIQAAPWVSTLGMIFLILIYGIAVLKILRTQLCRRCESLLSGTKPELPFKK